MAIQIQVVFNQAANVGRSYYENLAGGTTATVVVFNDSGFPLNAVFTVTGSPPLTYTVPANSNFGIGLNGLLVVGILSSAAGAVNGFININVADF